MNISASSHRSMIGDIPRHYKACLIATTETGGYSLVVLGYISWVRTWWFIPRIVFVA